MIWRAQERNDEYAADSWWLYYIILDENEERIAEIPHSKMEIINTIAAAPETLEELERLKSVVADEMTIQFKPASMALNPFAKPLGTYGYHGIGEIRLYADKDGLKAYINNNLDELYFLPEEDLIKHIIEVARKS